MRRKYGFTLVELLVVISVISLLMSILMPVLRNARAQALRAFCGSNIKNLHLGMTMYADAHSNKILTGSGFWPWDLEKNTARILLKNMGVDTAALGGSVLPLDYSKYFYCPANTQQKRYRREYWYFTGEVGGYTVGSYTFMWPAPWNNNGKLEIIGLAKGIAGDALKKDPSKIWIDRIDVPQGSSRELIVDSVLSQVSGYDPVKYPSGSFGMVTVGGIPNIGSPDQTNHIINDQKPSGANIGFLDGHVEWRSFTDIKLRLIVSNNNPHGDPHWWW